MRYYSVHAPPDAPDEPERFAFIKDGFSWPAFFVSVLWMLWHRLWLALVWYVVFLLSVAWIGRLVSQDAATVVAVLGTVLLALEGNNIRRRSLEGRGWDEIGASFGKGISEAEARFFAGGPAEPDPRDRRAAMLRAAYSPEHPGPVASDEPILGLFPEPEK
jgi:Protein of unknown function (DUF2628)